MAIADVYDALISRRVYKVPYSHAEAVFFILSQRGKRFDPVVVDAFEALQDEFLRIARAFPDNILVN